MSQQVFVKITCNAPDCDAFFQDEACITVYHSEYEVDYDVDPDSYPPDWKTSQEHWSASVKHWCPDHAHLCPGF